MPEASPKAPKALYEEALLRAEGLDPAAVRYGLVFRAVATSLEPMVKQCAEQPEDDYVRRIFWEYFLFRCIPRDASSNCPSKYVLVPDVPLQVAGAGTPDPGALPIEALQHFRDRLAQTNNLILRARYAEICWDRREESCIGHKESAAAGRTAAQAHTQLAEVVGRQDGSRLTAVRLYDRATVLARVLNDDALLGEVVTRALGTAGTWLSATDPRHVPKLVRLLLEVRSTKHGRTLVSDTALLALASRLKGLSQSRSSVNELLRARPLLRAVSDIHHALGDDITGNQLLEEEAATWEQQARLVPQAAGWLKSHWYEQAANLYRKTGNRAKLGEMMTKMLDANHESVTRGEFKCIATPVEESAEALSQFWHKYTSGPDLSACLTALVNDDDLLPAREFCERETKDALAQPSLWNMLSKAVYKDGRRVLQTQSQGESLELSANDLMRFCTGRVVVFVVAPVLATLRENGSLTETSLVEFLESRGHLATESKPLLLQGIHHYFQSQLVAAIYILVPLIERTIRDICVRASIDITPPRAGGYKAKTLDTMLTMPEVERLLGNRVRDYLRFVLCGEAEGAMNLRNDVAHGFLRAEECSQEKADLVLFITLVLSRFSHQPGATVVDSTKPSEGRA